jgi:hypothetical protein
MDWIHLKGKEPVTWKNIQESYIFMKTVSPNFTVNEEDLFDEFASVEKNILKANLKCGVN